MYYCNVLCIFGSRIGHPDNISLCWTDISCQLAIIGASRHLQPTVKQQLSSHVTMQSATGTCYPGLDWLVSMLLFYEEYLSRLKCTNNLSHLIRQIHCNQLSVTCVSTVSKWLNKWHYHLRHRKSRNITVRLAAIFNVSGQNLTARIWHIRAYEIYIVLRSFSLVQRDTCINQLQCMYTYFSPPYLRKCATFHQNVRMPLIVGHAMSPSQRCSQWPSTQLTHSPDATVSSYVAAARLPTVLAATGSHWEIY